MKGIKIIRQELDDIIKNYFISEKVINSPIQQQSLVFVSLEKEVMLFNGFQEYRFLLNRLSNILKKRENTSNVLKIQPLCIVRESKKNICN